MSKLISENEAVSILKQIDLELAEIKLRSDGIMQFDLKPCNSFTINDLKEVNNAAAILGGGKAFPRLTHIKHFFNIDKDLRAYAASEESNITTLAAAFVVNLLPLKLVGNFYIAFNKPVRPTKLFSTEEKAVEWLKTFI